MRNIILIIFTFSIFSCSALAQTQADKYYDTQEMAKARAALKAGVGGQLNSLILVDRVEYLSANGGELFWDAQGWFGGDINRIWIKSEGGYSFGDDEFEEAGLEVMYGRAISPFFDLQIGLGQGLEKGPSPTYGVIGLQGLAPYWFEIDTNVMISTEGDLSASFEVEYDLLLTQRLIFQPRLEMVFSFQTNPEYEIGSGFTALDLGFRLRYEIKRQFAPYLGLNWSKKFGGTADFAQIAGNSTHNLSFVIGLRSWF